MKKVLMGVLGVGVVGLLGFVALVAAQPSELRVERSRIVAAPPEAVWPYASDLKRFVEWSPWEGLDPNQVAEFSDPSHGVGAWYTWKGNADVGSGRMTITAVEEPARVVEDLEFIEPFASEAVVTLTLEPVDGGTKVTWGFVTQNGFVSKAFDLIVGMDAMLGADFARGLDNLGALVEG